MLRTLGVLLLTTSALSWGTTGAELERSWSGPYHEHAMAVWEGGWAVARGSTVEIWDPDHLGSPRHTLTQHSSDVTALAATGDGRLLAVGERSGGRISVWDMHTQRKLTWTPPASGQTVDRLVGHQFTIWALAFSPDGKTLASGAYDTDVRLWDIGTGMEIGVLTDHRGWIRSVAFCPEGRILASSSCDGTVRLWNVASLREVHPPIRAGVNTYSVAFSPDGELLAAVTKPGQTLVYRAGDWTELWSYATPRSSATYVVAFSPDSSLVATGGFGGAVHVRNARTGDLVHELEGHTSAVWGAAFLNGGELLLTTDADGEMRLWQLEQ